MIHDIFVYELAWYNFNLELIFQKNEVFTIGRVKARNAGTRGAKREDTIPMTLIFVKINIESRTTTPISMKMCSKWIQEYFPICVFEFTLENFRAASPIQFTTWFMKGASSKKLHGTFFGFSRTWEKVTGGKRIFSLWESIENLWNTYWIIWA